VALVDGRALGVSIEPDTVALVDGRALGVSIEPDPSANGRALGVSIEPDTSADGRALAVSIEPNPVALMDDHALGVSIKNDPEFNNASRAETLVLETGTYNTPLIVSVVNVQSTTSTACDLSMDANFLPASSTAADSQLDRTVTQFPVRIASPTPTNVAPALQKKNSLSYKVRGTNSAKYSCFRYKIDTFDRV
jgi:hypothetical protein